MPPEGWPADGDAGICPDCDGSVRYMSGTWFHDDGKEDCDA